jgi:3-hydroxyacyl-CoA dehydrogenase
MGAGIVQVVAASGLKVTMIDKSQDALKKGQDIIQKSLARVAKKKFPENGGQEWISSVLANISTNLSVDVASKSDLVIEAIVENLSVKQKLFKDLDSICQKNAIFASNTSSLPIGSIA